MTVEQLIELLRSERSHVLPFVGSGMAIGAGAPRTPMLASELARRCGVDLPAGASLTEVTEGAEETLGVRSVQEHLAEMVTGWRLRPAPALTALCAIPAGRVYTTNYDDGIEISARSRGIEAVSLLPEARSAYMSNRAAIAARPHRPFRRDVERGRSRGNTPQS